MSNQLLDSTVTPKFLLSYSFPTIIGLMFMSAYSMIDGMFVAQLINTNALSAINIVFPLIMLAVAVGMMMATGGSAVVARLLGEKQEQHARETFSFLVITLTIGSIFLCAIGLVFLEPLLYLLGANDIIYEYALHYGLLTIILLPATIIGIIFQIFFITAGKAHLGLISTIIGGILNIVLDYVFIVHFNMGISGAAIATGIGYAIPAIAGIIYFSFIRSNILYLVKPVKHWHEFFESCRNGASEMVINLSQAIITFLLNNIMMRLAGESGVAAITIILYVQALLSAAFMGYATGIAPIVSFNYGKGDTQRIRHVFTISKRVLLIASIIACLIGLIFATPLVQLFTPRESPVFTMSIVGFRLSSFAFLWMGFNIFGSAFFTALANGKVSAMISFMRTFVFQIIAIFVCAYLFGVNGVFLALPIAESLGICVTFYYFRANKNRYSYA